ncbi:MAG: hypothetical protein LBU04_00845 [Christensenellaceae bacterium]|jgi:hypothetical protein|nr:hypothetical protein [Christensenellaceae bacterium]
MKDGGENQKLQFAIANADTVYILGVVASKNFDVVIPILKRKATKHLLQPRKGFLIILKTRKYFASTSDILEVYNDGG